MENQVQLIGNLGMDPESKQISDSLKASFTLATNTVYRDSDGNKKNHDRLAQRRRLGWSCPNHRPIR